MHWRKDDPGKGQDAWDEQKRENAGGGIRLKKNYKMTICYDGSRYYGWEHQPDRDTIQGRMENVLSRMCGEPVDVIGAGRTDAGVHARAMTANVVMDAIDRERGGRERSVEEIRAYMNHYLPDDIAVKEVREAAERFHARYKAVGKLYRYTCYDGPVKPVFQRKYVTALEERPNLEKMRQAASYLEGKHDYKSFCGNPRMKKSTVRVVDRIEITRKGSFLYFDVHGTGFLQNMVRILVGTLLEVGKGRWDPEQMVEILEAQNRQAAGPTAPAQGLCLIRVDY